MEFTVPQFIEKEPKIVGPFSFKQFIYIGTAGGLIVFLYFSIPSFTLFLLLAIILAGASLALALLKIGGIPLPQIIKNFFIFLTKPKIYLWAKKTVSPKIFLQERESKEKTRDEPSLKITEKSHLGKLSSFLEIKTK